MGMLSLLMFFFSKILFLENGIILYTELSFLISAHVSIMERDFDF